MRPVDDEDQAKRVGPSMELKQVHSQTDDDDVEPNFEDDDDDPEDIRVAAAHHRFEDDDETISLLSASPSSSVIAEQGMSQVLRSMRKRTSSRNLGCAIIGVVVFATFVGIAVGFSYVGTN